MPKYIFIMSKFKNMRRIFNGFIFSGRDRYKVNNAVINNIDKLIIKNVNVERFSEDKFPVKFR